MITVHIMRGIPGSGKSTTARKLATGPEYICSADDYFVRDGKYSFDPAGLHLAHRACLVKFLSLLARNRDNHPFDDTDIVVDNTNIRLWEYEPYMLAAYAAKARVKVYPHLPEQGVALDNFVAACAARNTHGVSLDKCRKMAKDFEKPEPCGTTLDCKP